MNLPAFPTDNLYKFVAIAGLVLAGYSLVFVYEQVWDLRLKIAQMEIDEDAYEMQFELHKKELDAYLKLDPSEFNKQDALKHVIERAREVMEQRTKISNKKIENAVLRQRLESYSNILMYSLFSGLLISINGFFLWYYRIQKPLERFMEARINAFVHLKKPNNPDENTPKQDAKNRSDQHWEA